MNTMFKKSISLFVSVILATTIFAQVERTDMPKRGNGKGHSKGNKKEIINKLNLSDAQKATLKEEKAEIKTKIKTIKNDQSLTETQKTEKMIELRKTEGNKLGTVLNEDQKKQLAQIKEERKEKRKEKTPEQKEKLKAAKESFEKEKEAINNNNSLTEEQKKAAIEKLKETRKTQMKGKLKKHHNKKDKGENV